VIDFIVAIEDCDFSKALGILEGFSPGVARESEPRSGSRFRTGVGASPPAAKQPGIHSPNQERELAQWRVAAWEKTMRAHIREAALPCEPFDEHTPLLLETRK
jgi:hypothetical protein